MSKNLFTIAFALAVIHGMAAGFAASTGAPAGDALGGFSNIAAFLMYGSAIWIGWTCVNASHAKDYAIGAAALVFLNHANWGNASAQVSNVPWGIGGYLSPIFSNLVYIVLLVAAVGMLKSLVDSARATANAHA